VIERDELDVSFVDPSGDVKEFEPYANTPGLHIWGGKEFHNHSTKTIADAALKVVTTEGPVHIEEITRALREAAGLKRSGSRVQDTVKRALSSLCRTKRIQRDGKFYDIPERELVSVRSRSALPNTRKKLEYVSDAELCQALSAVASGTLGVQPEELAWHTLRLMGFLRVTEDMKNRTLKVIDKLVESGVLRADNGELIVP
jgi:hypothetical protein